LRGSTFLTGPAHSNRRQASDFILLSTSPALSMPVVGNDAPKPGGRGAGRRCFGPFVVDERLAAVQNGDDISNCAHPPASPCLVQAGGGRSTQSACRAHTWRSGPTTTASTTSQHSPDLEHRRTGILYSDQTCATGSVRSSRRLPDPRTARSARSAARSEPRAGCDARPRALHGHATAMSGDHARVADGDPDLDSARCFGFTSGLIAPVRCRQPCERPDCARWTAATREQSPTQSSRTQPNAREEPP